MFLHFGILTYTGSWSKPNLDIKQFNPTGLDPGPVGRRRGGRPDEVRRAHHASTTTASRSGPATPATSTSATSPGATAEGDVVREYVDAFRSRGLLPGLYYSIWDTTEEVAAGTPHARQAGLRQDAAHRAAHQLRPDPDPDRRRLVVADGPQRRRLPGDPRAGEVAAAELPADRSRAPRRPLGHGHRQLRGAARRLGARPATPTRPSKSRR